MARPIICGVDDTDGAREAVRASRATSASGCEAHSYLFTWHRRTCRQGRRPSRTGVRTAETLKEIARAERAELIVLGSRGRGPLSSALLGSVSAEVAAAAPCPVVIVPPGAGQPVQGRQGEEGGEGAGG